MKKITLLFFCVLSTWAFSQPVTTLLAPPYDGGQAVLSAPSGTSASVYHRHSFLILQNELTGLALTNSVITNVAYNLLQGVNAGVVGTATLYLENTTDATYLKGTNWATILTGMLPYYTGAFNLPTTATTIPMALTTNFTYTGGGIYVALDWYGPAANASQLAVYASNYQGLANGCVRQGAPSAGPAPTTMTTSNFRPCLTLSAANTATNEVAVLSMQATGRVTQFDGYGDVITARVRNNSNQALSNVSVALVAAGANPFSNVVTIPSIGAGSIQTVSFPPYVSTVAGANNITVSVLPDQDNNNNGWVFTQSVTCSEIGVSPAFAPSSFSAASYGAANAAGAIFAFRYTTGTATSSLVSVNCVVPSYSAASNVGNSLKAVLCDATGNIVASGNPVTITSSNMNTMLAFPFQNAVGLTPNTTYFFGVAVTNNTCFPFGYVNSPYLINNHYVIPIAGGTPSQNDLDYVSLNASLVYSNTAISVTSAATKTNVCRADKFLLTASGATSYTWTNSLNSTVVNTPTVLTSFSTTPVANYIVVGTNSSNGCKSNKVTYTFSVSACTGLENNEAYGATIRAYPNPAVNAKVTVTGLQGTNNVSVYNVLGQSILNFNINEEEVLLDLNEYPAGNYMIKVSAVNGTESKTFKVLTQH